ncbi:hypothetical protein FPZ45_01825 [Cohnella terricola]|uniref:Uncharacterized protein n=1 Tax=Cohnella terricola TaxID=1289167 RepID=A0A559JWT5_9BACL|nr:hypothetical protein FPZ45_01825 [Cohnella terricola]
MARRNRGNVHLVMPGRGRGQCPRCARSRINLLYDLVVGDGPATKVCKYCRPEKIVESKSVTFSERGVYP